MIGIGIASLVWYGCSSALKTEGVTITTVDAAMTVWGIYSTNSTVTDSQILTVSNAYVLYYNAQLVASNAWIIAVQQTNNTFWQSATQTAQASQTNLINIIKQFTSK